MCSRLYLHWKYEVEQINENVWKKGAILARRSANHKFLTLNLDVETIFYLFGTFVTF